MSENLYIFSAIAVMSLVTAVIRFAPFVIFRNKAPRVVLYLGKVLPEAVIALLVVYCLRDVSLLSGSHGLPEAIAIGVTVLLHKWKHNTLLSILAGTLGYMLLIQFVF